MTDLNLSEDGGQKIMGTENYGSFFFFFFKLKCS